MRGTAHRFLADKELDEQQIKRLADRCHDATHDSYLTNLPWQAVLGIAGYDYAGLQGVQFAAHTRVSVPDALFFLFAPWFPAQRIKVAAAIEEAKGSLPLWISAGLPSSVVGLQNALVVFLRDTPTSVGPSGIARKSSSVLR